MNNQLILKEDVSLFDKVRAFFKGLFSKKDKRVKEEVQVIKKQEKIENNIVEKNVNMNKDNGKNEYINFIESNPDIIEELPDDRLDKLIRYYRRIISLKRAKLNKLKESKN